VLHEIRLEPGLVLGLEARTLQHCSQICENLHKVSVTFGVNTGCALCPLWASAHRFQTLHNLLFGLTLMYGLESTITKSTSDLLNTEITRSDTMRSRQLSNRLLDHNMKSDRNSFLKAVVCKIDPI